MSGDLIAKRNGSRYIDKHTTHMSIYFETARGWVFASVCCSLFVYNEPGLETVAGNKASVRLRVSAVPLRSFKWYNQPSRTTAPS